MRPSSLSELGVWCEGAAGRVRAYAKQAASLRALLLVAVCAPAVAFALPEDRKQPIQIQADRFELDQVKGTGTYRGNVVLTQGSLELKADTVVLYRKGDKFTRAEAEGSPARFRQTPAADAKEITGEGQHLEYQVDDHKVLLTGSGRIEQGGDQFQGERIAYDTASGVIQANGGEGKGKGKGRINVTLQPREGNEAP